MPHCSVDRETLILRLTPEWIHRDQNRANICVDFRVGPPFLKIFIDAFIADGGQQGHIVNSDLLLLEPFLPVCLSMIFQSTSQSY